MEGAAPDSDERFAEWYVWAKREVSSDPRVCLGVAQAAIEALTSGADRPSAELAARKSVAGTAVVLLTKVSPWRRGYAQWYDWARIEFGGDPERLHRLARIAIQRLKSDPDAAQAAEAARAAAAAEPAAGPDASSEPPSGSSWAQSGPMSPGGWGGAAFATSTASTGADPGPAYAAPGEAAGPPPFGAPQPVAARPATPVSFDPVAYAGLGLRLGATAIDTVLGVVATAVIVFVAYVLFLVAVVSTREYSAGEGLLSELALLVIVSVLFWLYDAGLESSPARGTAGKRAVRLVVIDRYGRQVSFARATGRHFVKFVPLFLAVVPLYLSIPALLGGFVNILSLGVAVVGGVFLVCLVIELLMVAWTRQKQGLHDLIAGTLVVRREMLSRVVAPTAAPPPPASLPESYPDAAAPHPGETVPRTG